jgi:hypothetical protein
MITLQTKKIDLTLKVMHWTGFKTKEDFIKVFKELNQDTRIAIIKALKKGETSGYCLKYEDGQILDRSGIFAGVLHYMIACRNLANKLRSGCDFELDGVPAVMPISKVYKKAGWANRKKASVTNPVKTYFTRFTD